MRKVIRVPTIEDLEAKIPEIIDMSKGRNLFLAKEIIKPLRKNWEGTVVFLGEYNFFLGDGEEYPQFRRVLLIRRNAAGKYVHPDVSKENNFIEFNQ